MSQLTHGYRPPPDPERVPINIHPEVRQRLRDLLFDNPELRGVGYSSFINRACEATEGALIEERRERCT